MKQLWTRNMPGVFELEVSNLCNQFDVLDIIDCNQYSPGSIELYQRIKNLYCETFLDTQRIVFLVSQDFYQDNQPTMMLQTIQYMLNVVDIPNFFVCIVTTNSKIKDDYQWIVDNVSTDKVPAHLYVCPGEYQYKYDSLKKISFNLKSLSLAQGSIDHQTNQLFESEAFCILPWISFYVNHDQSVSPCCHSSAKMGDFTAQPLEDIMNSDEACRIRLDMLANKLVDSCSKCYNLENNNLQSSPRVSFNTKFVHAISEVKQTQPDGKLPAFRAKMVSARFNNVCNLSCRSCSPSLSTSWHKPAASTGLYPVGKKVLKVFGKDKKQLLEELTAHVDTIEQIIFEGGEPFLIEECYDLLKVLDQRKRHDVLLSYVTNLTVGVRKSDIIFDLWEKFNNITIHASLDAEGERNNYLRPGGKWENIVDFRRKMIDLRPDIYFSVIPTVSIFNALHLPDFQKSWHEQGLAPAENWRLNLTLKSPAYMRMSTAPRPLKEAIAEKYVTHLEWLRPMDHSGAATDGFLSVIESLKNDHPFDATSFWNNTDVLDNYYNTSLTNVFPELTNFIKRP